MFRSTKDFLNVWSEHTLDTEKILRSLTDASLLQQVTEDHRTLGRLGWHITLTMSEMLGEAGMKISPPAHEDVVPKTARAILDAYQTMHSQVSDYVQSKLNDADLLVEVPMYGGTWTKGQVLFALVAHEIHHRGQMTVLMRQAGLRVPGVLGPAREDWAQFGMPAPAI